MEYRFATLADLENYVDSLLGDGGQMTEGEINTAKLYIAKQIRNTAGFEYGIDVTDILENIDDNQWNKWLEESLNQK